MHPLIPLGWLFEGDSGGLPAQVKQTMVRLIGTMTNITKVRR